MQLYMNSFFKILLGIILLFLVITVTCLLISIIKILQVKRINYELHDCITCKDNVIDEFTKMRHEYNNMLQTITCMIEEEDIQALKEYKDKLLEKTQLLNRNSITQLVKIKNIKILRWIYKLFINAKDEGYVLQITIYNDISNQRLYKDEYYYILKECLTTAYESSSKQVRVIDLSISSNDEGISFIFKNESNIEFKKLVSQTMKSRKYKIHKNKNIIYNNFYKNKHFVQEILISFNF